MGKFKGFEVQRCCYRMRRDLCDSRGGGGGLVKSTGEVLDELHDGVFTLQFGVC